VQVAHLAAVLRPRLGAGDEDVERGAGRIGELDAHPHRPFPRPGAGLVRPRPPQHLNPFVASRHGHGGGLEIVFVDLTRGRSEHGCDEPTGQQSLHRRHIRPGHERGDLPDLPALDGDQVAGGHQLQELLETELHLAAAPLARPDHPSLNVHAHQALVQLMGALVRLALVAGRGTGIVRQPQQLARRFHQLRVAAGPGDPIR
jgi:hypothetical protein